MYESRLITDSHGVKHTYEEICQAVYLLVLILTFLNRTQIGHQLAQSYANATAKYGDYAEFRISATDLHNLIYLLTCEPSQVAELFSSEHAKQARINTSVPRAELCRYISHASQDRECDLYFLPRLERSLKIRNPALIEIRRIITMTAPSTSDLRLAANRVINAAGSDIPNVDIMPKIMSALTSGNFKLRSSEDKNSKFG